MYQPAHFQVADEAELLALIAAQPLAAVVRNRADGSGTGTGSSGGSGFDADHVPLRFDAPSRSLRGHVARANPLWQQAQAAGEQGLAVLALFSAEQAYVSPNGYPSKALNHKVVPTWNYTVVHAHGRLFAHDDVQWLRSFLQSLTTEHEAHQTHQAKPWHMSDAPADYISTMLRAIVGIELRIESLEGKFKLSQNRSAEDQRGVVSNLRSLGTAQAEALAQRMGGTLG